MIETVFFWFSDMTLFDSHKSNEVGPILALILHEQSKAKEGELWSRTAILHSKYLDLYGSRYIP